MKLLVITQKVNKNDSNLGFFHLWLQKLAAQVDHLYVVCLEKGGYNLPSNVTVISLGKENKRTSSLIYSFQFYRALWKLRGKYENVFVHMNPEYAILAGWLWRVTGKKVLLWYVHKAVNWRLRLGALFATKIFTASKESFRMPSKKVEVVGHGIPVEIFAKQQLKRSSGVLEAPIGTLFLMSAGRISPAKDLETVFRALEALRKNTALPGWNYKFFGRPITQQDEYYKNKIENLASQLLEPIFKIEDQTNLYDQMPMIYQEHYILIHTSQTGSMDKVVLEALASGRIVVTSSEVFASLADGELKGVVFKFPQGNSQELANTIEKIYKNGILNTIPNQRGIDYVMQHHNLDNLVRKIIGYFKSV